jgi:hypothetical protein
VRTHAHSLVGDSHDNVFIASSNEVKALLFKLGPDGFPSPSWPDQGEGVGVRAYAPGPLDLDYWPQFLSAVLDRNGDIFVAGTALTSSFMDALVAKYNAAGERLWLTYYDGPWLPFEQEFTDVLLSRSGDVFALGYCNPTGFFNACFLIRLERDGRLSNDWSDVGAGLGARFYMKVHTQLAAAISGNSRIIVTGGGQGQNSFDGIAYVVCFRIDGRR